ncbi:aminoacyl-histidine dipeptidase [Chloropicon primus]|uniref:Aminoacyl-histidine dipeptidase n=1 Tax=Chloropicon primus TaxID=1764295 RepID=A0A5B8MD03_9CHLO|nr:aminoacyl-histidine dipeptidase [Chloropicon primus]UPQ97209.1 aminoacyl-histidine dipeptidase [Chloropicon primus]|eukprot:QDZ17994.1 aminoacyl-histidine dipeptidase [Chloropicon primus]
MVGVTEGLEPRVIWKHFETLASIPRRSREEEGVLEYIKGFAEENGLKWRQDEAGNICVRREGSVKGAPTVVIQGHVDMVCEKEKDSSHDFSEDPIALKIEGDWLKARGTTLGADNGLGVAAALALLEMPEDADLPPLEGLFTVQEEIGLVGAKALDPSIVEGRILLNLDAEDWPNVYCGCAGGGISNIALRCRRERVDLGEFRPAVLAVGGLVGGHSGADIHKYHASAVKVAARVLSGLMEAGLCRLADVSAGDKQHNVIPRTSEARVYVRRSGDGQGDAAKEVLDRIAGELKLEYGVLEKGMEVALSVAEDGAFGKGVALTEEDGRKLVSVLNVLPHGPVKFSHSIPELVETSNNIASVKCKAAEGAAASDDAGDVEFVIMCSTRSSVNGAIEAVRGQFRSLAGLCGATVTGNVPYPGWQPNLESPILKVTVDEVTKIIGRKPEVTAIHAGLECGIIGEKLQGCDMVAFGPTILGAHTPEERVKISTVSPFWDLVQRVVEASSKQK